MIQFIIPNYLSLNNWIIPHTPHEMSESFYLMVMLMVRKNASKEAYRRLKLPRIKYIFIDEQFFCVPAKNRNTILTYC